MTIDMTKRSTEGNWAHYLPAISGFYTKQLGKILADPNFVAPSRVPAGFEHGFEGVNFLDPENSYYHYGVALYSAGHADRNLARCDDKEPMVHKRDRSKTIIVGDSAGFQLATGVIKMDWANFKGAAGDRFREEILRYLEHTADWSMTLDIPAFAAVPPLSAKTGLTKFEDTLDLSIHNLQYFMKHRVPGATKFLNVISGSTPDNSKQWYDAVKHFSILQKHYNPNINLSFDAASPFVAAGGYALSYNYNYFTPQRLTYCMGKSVDDKGLKNSKLGMPHQGPIMERLTVGDICAMGATDANKNGKIGKTSWDTMSYLLIMAHNVYNHIQAVQEALRLADVEYARTSVSYKDATGLGKKAPNLSEFIPNSIIYFNHLVEVLFDPSTTMVDARQMIVDNNTFLTSISFGSKPAKISDIFDTEEEIPDEDEMTNMDNEKLMSLENDLDD